MTSILVVCTGNICRSPIAEGLLRDALVGRFGDRSPKVSSAGTMGWVGSGAMPESVQAAAERGTDIGSHRARRLSARLIADANLVVGMAGEHSEAVVKRVPDAAARTFTLKELVRLLEGLPRAAAAGDPDTLASRVAEANEARRVDGPGNRLDQDVADPLGMPLDSYRATAWELDGWTSRLVDGLYGAVPKAAEG